jgi:Holliday junction resolvase-like predicted endonuclease
LERYFTEKLATQNLYSAIGTYWEKGNHNEIDIIAVNDFEKTVLVAEVKRRKENISIPLLQEKGKNLLNQLKGYTFEYQGFSVDDM